MVKPVLSNFYWIQVCLKEGYADWAALECAKQAAGYMDLLAHQTPGMNILEVGGGTAATTRSLVGALRSGQEGSMRSLRCGRYDFTDISPAFLEKAREEFANHESQMTFGTLNIERDFAEQGYSEGFYDVVAADNVLHVTSDLGKTLRNIRKALKPGGKLIMHEFLRPTGLTAGFIFGTFPGWWLGAADNRTLSPALAPNEWDVIMKSNGFSGVDIVFRDFDDDVAHQVGWLVTTATEDDSTSPLLVKRNEKQQAVIVVDKTSEEQQSLSNELVPLFHELTGTNPQIVDLTMAAAETEIENDALVILLVDFGKSFIASLNESTWSSMSSLIQRSRRLLWVSAGGGREVNPDHGMLDGLARTLRTEKYDLHLVTVALDLAATKSSKSTLVMNVAKEMLSREAHQSYEQDYSEIDGLLYTRRLNEAAHIKSAIDARVAPYQDVPTPLDGSARFKVSTVAFSGADDSPHYVQIPEAPQKLSSNDTVEILVRATTLQSRARNLVLENKDDPTQGNYCSGTVSRANARSGFVPGDRVLAAYKGVIASHVEVSSQLVALLPVDLSFTDACSILPPVVAAYHAIVEVAVVKPRQSILIYNGATAFGQAAIKLLASRGVTDVWTTADNREESAWIVTNQLVPAGRILPKAWFGSESILITHLKRRFDIVLTQASDAATMLLHYVKSGGRCITVDTSAALAKNFDTIRYAPKDVCMCTISSGTITPESLAYALTFPIPAMKSLKNETKIMLASDLSTIFARSQSPHECSTAIIEFSDQDTVDVSLNYSLSML